MYHRFHQPITSPRMPLQEAQLGLGPFGITPSRNEVIEYTAPILIDYIRIMAGRGRPEVDPWGFLFPLTAGVWAAFLASLLLVTVSTFVLSAATPKALGSGGGSSYEYFGYFRVLLQQGKGFYTLSLISLFSVIHYGRQHTS